jgi:hypothetical protein
MGAGEFGAQPSVHVGVVAAEIGIQREGLATDEAFIWPVMLFSVLARRPMLASAFVVMFVSICGHWIQHGFSETHLLVVTSRAEDFVTVRASDDLAFFFVLCCSKAQLSSVGRMTDVSSRGS